MVIESVTEEEELEQPMAGEPPTQELGKIIIGTVSQEEMPTHAGEDEL